MSFRGTIHDINRERERGGFLPLLDLWGRPDPQPVVTEPTKTPVDYETGQKIALLLLRKGELADDLVNRLRAMGADVGPEDWRTLEKHGRVVGHEGNRRLTPMGLHAAQEIAHDLARKLGIHSITRRRGTGNHGPSITCTCGFHTYSSIMNDNALERYAGEHLQQAREGTLPAAFRFGARPS